MEQIGVGAFIRRKSFNKFLFYDVTIHACNFPFRWLHNISSLVRAVLKQTVRALGFMSSVDVHSTQTFTTPSAEWLPIYTTNEGGKKEKL